MTKIEHARKKHRLRKGAGLLGRLIHIRNSEHLIGERAICEVLDESILEIKSLRARARTHARQMRKAR